MRLLKNPETNYISCKMFKNPDQGTSDSRYMLLGSSAMSVVPSWHCPGRQTV
jgi:hypothetical protein